MTLWAAPALTSAAYQLLAVAAALRWKRQPALRTPTFCLPLSVLKPVYGRDDRLYSALRSHAVQEYPQFEILFGLRSQFALASYLIGNYRQHQHFLYYQDDLRVNSKLFLRPI